MRRRTDGGAGVAPSASPSYSYRGKTGGTSSFGDLISATGGTGGYASKDGTYTGGTGGSPNGRNGTRKSGSGHSNTLPNQGGFPLSFTIGSGSYGSGGGAVCSSYSSYIASGGSGGYNTGYVDVTPGTSYTITVGAGGIKGDTDDSRAHGYDGTSGFVYIGYGGDI